MRNNEPFAAFCNRVAGTGGIIPDGDHTLPEEYEKTAEALVSKLRRERATFPKYAVTGIQSRFDDMIEVAKTLEEKTKHTDGEIPNGLLVWIAYQLYTDDPEKPVGYNDLPETLQNIIKVVSCYLILQS